MRKHKVNEPFINKIKNGAIMGGAEVYNYGRMVLKGFALDLLKPMLYRSKVISDDEYEAATEGFSNSSHSTFGLPVFDILTFDDMSYTRSDNTMIELTSVELGIVLIDVSMTKNIVTTVMTGDKGTVKEFISNGDYSLDIKGIIVGDGQDVFPLDDVIALKEYLIASDAIPVTSAMLNEVYNINTIVVTDFTFHQEEGMRNVIRYEIKALSDIVYTPTTQNSSPPGTGSHMGERYL